MEVLEGRTHGHNPGGFGFLPEGAEPTGIVLVRGPFFHRKGEASTANSFPGSS